MVSPGGVGQVTGVPYSERPIVEVNRYLRLKGKILDPTDVIAKLPGLQLGEAITLKYLLNEVCCRVNHAEGTVTKKVVMMINSNKIKEEILS